MSNFLKRATSLSNNLFTMKSFRSTPRSANRSAKQRNSSASFVMMQVQEMVVRGQVRCVDGVSRALKIESICLHSDTPGAVEMAQLISRGLKELNVEVRPCS